MSVYLSGSAASYGRRALGLRGAAVFLAILACGSARPAEAQSAESQSAEASAATSVARIVAAREAAERAHLWRVGAWGAASVAAGAALLAASRGGGRPGRRAFGVQAAAWGAVNVAIAAVALSQADADTLAALGDALRAETRLGSVLWLNVGLDAGYMAVGATLWAAASRGVPSPAAWRGHGQALVVQGAALLALDAVVLAGSSGRFGALADLAAVLVPVDGGVALVVAF